MERVLTVPAQSLRKRSSTTVAVAAAAAERWQQRQQAQHAQPAQQGWPAVRESSQDSFASCSSGDGKLSVGAEEDCSTPSHHRPAGLPRLQTHYSSARVFGQNQFQPQQARPEFLPPLPPEQPAPIAKWRETVEQRRLEAELASGDGSAELDEFLSWLPQATGSNTEHLGQIIAWLVQLLRWSETDDENLIRFQKASEVLPNANLERIFREVCARREAGCNESSQEMLAIGFLEDITLIACRNIHNLPLQRLALCTLAFKRLCCSLGADLRHHQDEDWIAAASAAHQGDKCVYRWLSLLQR